MLWKLLLIAAGLAIVYAVLPQVPPRTRPWVIAGVILVTVVLLAWIVYTWIQLNV